MRAIDEAKILGIDARAVDGVVTLWGATVSARERSRAGEIAARVEGVKALENRLEVVTGS
jgi:osmotically-inducible protein OsmY